ncbi:MAG: 3'-5' exoribonuclease [Eubacterium sp.]|nr:3'-5' exoribonuclease [Eubacterium sp.]
MNKRTEKGNSLIIFPESYVVIDIETTGLSPEFDSIIEVGAIKYISGNETGRFSSLIQPDCVDDDGNYICDFIQQLTGITNDMLAIAPTADEVLPKFYDFIKDSLLVGHNVNFDINFLYDNLEKHLDLVLSNDFVDTMRISRNLHPEIRHHSLSDVLNRYKIDYLKAHRVLADCEMTHFALSALQEDACSIHGSIDYFCEYIQKRSKHKAHLKAADIEATITEINEDNPIFGKVFVFTGALDRMLRKEAMQLVVNHGGINGDSVTKKTNYLVLGNNDYCKSIKDGKSSKQKKAEKLKLDGLDIEIITEDVFYDMIEG